MSDNVLCKELFAEGKRQFFVGNFDAALKNLSEACSKMAAEKGDTADELFEPYFYYSKALYSFHKLCPDVIGEGVPETTAEEKNKEVVIEEGESSVNQEREDNVEVVTEHKNDNKNVAEKEDNTGVVPELKNDDKKMEENEDGEKEEISENEESEGTEDDVKSEVEGDENVGYLQMSYETIECAKLIIKRQISEKILEEKILDCRLADCCDIAGDIYVEEEVIDEAIVEYKTALVLRQRHLAPSDRTIAESYYKIAVAYNIDYRSKEAKENFLKCREILKTQRDESVKRKEDTLELEDIIKEIDEKISESEESEKELLRAKECLKQLFPLPLPLTTESSDISHLVRKRKTDDGSDAPSKKQSKTEDN